MNMVAFADQTLTIRPLALIEMEWKRKIEGVRAETFGRRRKGCCHANGAQGEPVELCVAAGPAEGEGMQAAVAAYGKGYQGLAFQMDPRRTPGRNPCP